MQMDLYNTHNGHGTIAFTAVVIVVFKDIVQPKKRGVKRCINRFVSTSYTIADIFLNT